ncbi:MAG: hypothetical protein Q9216_001810 [Gyalolechia sp. 2 TL-2023]
MGPAVWLRTCYTTGSDEKHKSLIEGIDMYNAVDGDHRLLDDPELYSYGADWQRVFEVVPELLEPNDRDWASYEDAQREAVEGLRAYAGGGVARAEPGLVSNLASGEFGFKGQELEYHVAKALQAEVHRVRVVAWVVLEDEEALESGNVAVIFVDALGRVVRSTRVPAGDAESMGGAWADGCWDEMTEWTDGDLGPQYRLGGECGWLLLESMLDA